MAAPEPAWKHHLRHRAAERGERPSAGDYPEGVSETGATAEVGGYIPPALPPVTTGLWHIAVPGTLIWLAGFIVLLFFIPQLQANDAMIWLWTCLAGFVLGLMGLSVYALQRRAARLGRRSANQMALDETI